MFLNRPRQLKAVYNDEFIATELGQVGTQFDGPGHIGVHTAQGHFYGVTGSPGNPIALY